MQSILAETPVPLWYAYVDYGDEIIIMGGILN